MTLNEGAPGSAYVVKEIKLNEKITHRLQMLGMTDGVTVYLLGKKRSGSVIFRLRGCRYALGSAFASGITVEEAE